MKYIYISPSCYCFFLLILWHIKDFFFWVIIERYRSIWKVWKHYELNKCKSGCCFLLHMQFLVTNDLLLSFWIVDSLNHCCSKNFFYLFYHTYFETKEIELGCDKNIKVNKSFYFQKRNFFFWIKRYFLLRHTMMENFLAFW